MRAPVTRDKRGGQSHRETICCFSGLVSRGATDPAVRKGPSFQGSSVSSREGQVAFKVAYLPRRGPIWGGSIISTVSRLSSEFDQRRGGICRRRQRDAHTSHAGTRLADKFFQGTGELVRGRRDWSLATLGCHCCYDCSCNSLLLLLRWQRQILTAAGFKVEAAVWHDGVSSRRKMQEQQEHEHKHGWGANWTHDSVGAWGSRGTGDWKAAIERRAASPSG
ncbi:hypothetical protein Cob_v006370 [Colletotrichum orbiculare MAFF 240422]|uniref:Uncharacterized protein n=1 Tax=Colletotrichum orbiculare (strain 104-T / ATCC 96160 / CBS 514.97 / LARS 414 / MAFF 240422) TaxID=1213857 RepID=A0A484FRM3_COLOR|nr:hypothetical protein Cob_v006370 [Colletotrichum orbiculare MAFF 240422]